MKLRDIKQAVIDQRNYLENLKNDRLIDRDVLMEYKKHIPSNLIKVILGVRRCGKSTLSYQLLKDEKFAYINFDDERLTSLETNDLNKVLESFYEVHGQFKYVLLDEVQNIYGWELFVNRLQRQGLNIIVTGSNAKLLSKELATHLTGRHIPLELFPFSFKEFLEFHDIKLGLLSTKDKGIIKNYLNSYIKKGGFPEILKGNIIADSYLRSLYSTILDKDVILRKKVKYITAIKDISNYLISNHSSQVSFNKIKNIFNLGSIHTALNYVSYLEEAYLFFFIKRLSYKYKESLIANRKIYVIDTGLIHSLSLKYSHDIGRLYENIVAIELLRRRGEIFYWQDIQKNEVDFVIKHGLKIKELIQVCYDIDDYNVRKRETRSLLKAMKEFRMKRGIIITDEHEDEEVIGNKKLVYIPLWKWLLEG